MRCKGSELARRDVVCIRDGQRVGFGCDFEFDTQTARITALILPGRKRLFGLFGKEDDTVVPWECVKVIGNDIILIDFDISHRYRKNKGTFFENILN